jgi:hypothetical protein
MAEKANEPEIKTIGETIQYGIETAIRYLIFWESDDKTIRIVIQMCCHAFFYGMILWYIYLHTFSDSYLQYVFFCFIYFLVWVHHIFFRVCLFFNMEQKVMGNHVRIIDNILHIFHITPSEEVTKGVLLLVSSLIMAMLSFELLSRTIGCIKSLHQFK